MNEQKLHRMVDLILRSAGEEDLELLQAAMEQRRTSLRSSRPHPGEMAREMAENISRQVEQSLGQVQGMVRETVADIIRRKAPELSEDQVALLLRAWLPGREPSGASTGAPSERPAKAGALPAQALLTMVGQFVSYSTGAMSVSEQSQLRETIPDWQRIYWERFPESVRRLVREFLQQRIGAEQFWQRLRARLSPE